MKLELFDPQEWTDKEIDEFAHMHMMNTVEGVICQYCNSPIREDEFKQIVASPSAPSTKKYQGKVEPAHKSCYVFAGSPGMKK